MAHYYVHYTNGNDAWPGTEAQPWKNISKVNSTALVAGDIVSFAKGQTWSGTTLVCDNAGTNGNRITYNSYGSGNKPVISVTGQWSDCINITADYVTIDGFYLQSAGDYGVDVASGADYGIITNCEIYDCGGAARFQGSHVTFSYNYAHDLKMIHNDVGGDDDYGATGIICENGSSYAEIHHNTFYKCRAVSSDYGYDGGCLEIYATGQTITNILFHHNWCQECAGVLEGGGNGGSSQGSNIYLYMNVLHNNGVTCMWHNSGTFFVTPYEVHVDNNTIIEEGSIGNWRVMDYSDPNIVTSTQFRFRNNAVYVNNYNAVHDSGNIQHIYNRYELAGSSSLGCSLGTGESTGVLTLVNRGADDFHPDTGSALIDNGYPSGLGYSTDYEDSPVPQGSGYDIGCFEAPTGATWYGAAVLPAGATLAAIAAGVFGKAVLAATGTVACVAYVNIYVPPETPMLSFYPAMYQVWLEDASFNKVAYIREWTHLEYRTSLNTYGYATLEVDPTHLKIPSMKVMKRLKIMRNGVLVFGGWVLREQFTIPNTAPYQEKYQIHAQDYGVYSDWRTVLPEEGLEYNHKVGPADDIAKAYVYDVMGGGAISARQLSDVFIAPNLSQAPELSYDARNVILTTVLENIADQSGIWWQWMPTETGSTFLTRYPLWGLNRTKGNGVTEECVFSLDRRNFDELTYQKDLLTHYNYIYIWGQGEGVDRQHTEGSDDTAIALYKRRERYVDARHVETMVTLEDQLVGELWDRRPIIMVGVRPKPSTWMTKWNLGDVVTVIIKRYDQTYEMNYVITDVSVTVNDDGTEDIVPQMEEWSA